MSFASWPPYPTVQHTIVFSSRQHLHYWNRIVDRVISLAPLLLPTYILLWILEFDSDLGMLSQEWMTHGQQVELIRNVNEVSIRKIYAAR